MANLRAPALASERSDRFEVTNGKWLVADDVSAGTRHAGEELTRDWNDEVQGVALKAGAIGRSAPHGGWNLAFLDFLRAHPEHARTFAKMLFRVAHPHGFTTDTLDDAYFRFAQDVGGSRGTAPDPRDKLVVESPAFHPPAPPPPVPSRPYGPGPYGPGMHDRPIELPHPRPAFHGI